MKKNILILGATGMLGNCIYSYLSAVSADNILGTSRKDNNKTFYKLDAKSFEKDLNNILKKTKHIEYIINCIGALKNKSKKEIFFVNAELPVKLVNIAQKHKIKIIQISSDAVFPKNAGKVSESDSPNPIDNYGKSKLQGEVDSKYMISFRTSIIGLDPIEHKGLLEWSLSAKPPIYGYSNQFWSGCTTLQFAKLCEKIINSNSFNKLRNKSKIFHFAPLGNLSKYEILLTFFKITGNKKKIISAKGKSNNRQLTSNFRREFEKFKFKNDINSALSELLSFK